MAKKKKQQSVDVTRGIRVDYLPEDINRMATQMTDAMSDVENLQEDLKNEASKFKSSIQAKETEIKTLKNEIQKGYRIEERPCKMIRNFDAEVREYWFDGKIVETEPLTAEDYQTELDLVEAENKKEEQRLEELDAAKNASPLKVVGDNEQN